MELPTSLKHLYRHWQTHTIQPDHPLNPIDVFSDPHLFDHLSWFIHERLEIWKKKTRGAVPPYTTDPILSTYRFCNIFREFDKQTIAFHQFLLPLRNDFPLWLLNMFASRMIARPETIEAVGLLLFDEKKNLDWLDRLRRSPRPRYGNAYVFPISSIQKSPTPTRELFLAEYVPTTIARIAQEIQTWNKMSVYDGVKKILPLFGFTLSFLWTEVLIDVAYQFPERIDLFRRFPIGPGSRPTLERINPAIDPSLLVQDLSRVPLDVGLTYEGKPLRLSAENWEGIGCEYRKYTNLKSGHGRKRRYQAIS